MIYSLPRHTQINMYSIIKASAGLKFATFGLTAEESPYATDEDRHELGMVPLVKVKNQSENLKVI